MTLTSDRVRGRLVDIEIGAVEGLGWVAVGIVTAGLAHEIGLRFDATASTSEEAERRLREEIEAYFA